MTRNDDRPALPVAPPVTGGLRIERKRRRLFRIGLAGLGLGLIAAAVAGLLFVTSAFLPLVDPVKDEAGLHVVQQRLSAAVGDVDAVVDPANTKATGAAEVLGCDMDSGEVFEPELYRAWRLEVLARARSRHHNRVTGAGRQAGSSIATALLERGWSGSAELTGKDPASTALTKRFDGYTVTLTVAVYDSSVVAEGDTPYRRVCRSTE